jgi:hypothetical protein
MKETAVREAMDVVPKKFARIPRVTIEEISEEEVVGRASMCTMISRTTPSHIFRRVW